MPPALRYETDCGVVQFDSLHRTSVKITPIRDEAGRAVIAIEYEITLHGYVLSPVDQIMDEIREVLTASAGHLTYSDTGVNLDVNAPGSNVRDCNWGPHPQLIEYTPLGGDPTQAARVMWTVRTRIPECCEEVSSVRRLMALNLTIANGVDESGWGREQVAGYFEVPLTRTRPGDRTLPDLADHYRKDVLGRRPPAIGWQRKNQTYKLSPDGRRVDFSWEDEEMPVPFPRRVGKIQATHDVETTLNPGGLKKWRVSINATIQMARGTPKSEALKVFFLIVEAKKPGLSVPARAAVGRGRTLFLPQRLRVSDDIFGKGTRFTLDATFQELGRVSEFMARSRLWEPIPGTGHTEWRGDLANVIRPTGGADLHQRAQEQQIVDLCIPNAERSLSTVGRANPPEQTKANLSRNEDPTSPPDPPPEQTWIHFENHMRWDEDQNAARHKPLPEQPRDLLRTVPPGPDAMASPTLIMVAPGGLTAATPQGQQPVDTFQAVASPMRTLTMYGSGVRYGHRVPVPHITAINGVRPIELRRTVDELTPGAVQGVPIYGMRWTITYGVPVAPAGTIPTLSNPYLQTVATQSSVGQQGPTLRTSPGG